jgi:hypothetical protein
MGLSIRRQREGGSEREKEEKIECFINSLRDDRIIIIFTEGC